MLCLGLHGPQTAEVGALPQLCNAGVQCPEIDPNSGLLPDKRRPSKGLGVSAEVHVLPGGLCTLTCSPGLAVLSPLKSKPAV